MYAVVVHGTENSHKVVVVGSFRSRRKAQEECDLIETQTLNGVYPDSLMPEVVELKSHDDFFWSQHILPPK